MEINVPSFVWGFGIATLIWGAVVQNINICGFGLATLALLVSAMLIIKMFGD